MALTKIVDSIRHGKIVAHLTERRQIIIDERSGIFAILPRGIADSGAVFIAEIKDKSIERRYTKYSLDYTGLPLVATLTKRPKRSFDIRVPAFVRASIL